MEKQPNKKRIIHFTSRKNKKRLSVYSQSALAFAQKLDEDASIKSFKANVSLKNWAIIVSLLDIRTRFRQMEWSSDFVILMKDGSHQVREVLA